MTKFFLVFLTLNMSIGVNLDEGILARFGIDTNILIAAALAFVITGLICHRHLALIVLVVLLAIGANVPVESATEMGYDPDYLLAALIGIVIAPFVADQFDLRFLG